MLSLSRLPWMNLRGYPVRTGTLVFFSMLMTMTIFGGTLVVQGIEHGLRTTQSRLGADIMVTPDEADTDFDAQTFLVNAEPSYFYMDASTREAVAAVDGVEQAATAYEEAAGSSADLIRVAALARGENEAGTPLATWVLQARFEEVLVFANERLSQMSSGRYELIRVAEETSQRRRRKGLGLAVVDHLGDERTRDPRTLSGGETFYVSLSLALALADVVSAESGGVSLETLFIDEGFGTLDADTLQTVMAQIDHLRAGGRTVGIVSHVAELRDQIAERITVRRVASGGSTLKVTA